MPYCGNRNKRRNSGKLTGIRAETHATEEQAVCGVRRTIALTIVVLVLSAMPNTAAAQRQEGAVRAVPQSVIRGVLLDVATNRPIAGASVELLDSMGLVIDTEVSDSAGAFRVGTEDIGRHQVRATMIGFGAVTSDLLIIQRMTEVVDIVLRMGQQPISLAPLEVVARRSGGLMRGRDSYALHESMGQGRFMDPGYIAAKKPRETSGIFLAEEGITPITMPDGRLAFVANRGWRCIRTVVNGLSGGATPSLSVFGGPGAAGTAYRAVDQMARDLTTPDRMGTRMPGPSLDHMIRPEDIAGIEFFREWNEVPPEWRHFVWRGSDWTARPRGGLTDGLDACGLVLIWTHAAW